MSDIFPLITVTWPVTCLTLATCPRTWRLSVRPCWVTSPKILQRRESMITSRPRAAPPHAPDRHLHTNVTSASARRLPGKFLIFSVVIILTWLVSSPQCKVTDTLPVSLVPVKVTPSTPPSPTRQPTSLSRHRLSSQTSLEPRPKDSKKKKKKSLLCPSYEDSTDEIKGVQIEKTSSGASKSNIGKLGTFTSSRSRNKKGESGLL